MYEDNCQLLLVQFKANNVQYFIDYDDMKPEIRHQLIDSLGIKTCPYCNAQYITSWIDKSGSKHTTADLDHFYQKALRIDFHQAESKDTDKRLQA